MALFKQTFARVGAAPDLAALATAVRATVGDPFYLGAQFSTGGVVAIVSEKPTAWTGPQITAVQAAVTAAADATAQTDAQTRIDTMDIFDKAVLLTINDELNLLRTAAALATKTPAQMAALVRAKAATL